MDDVKLTESLKREIRSLGELSPTILTKSAIMKDVFEVFTRTKRVCTDLLAFQQAFLRDFYRRKADFSLSDVAVDLN